MNTYQTALQWHEMGIGCIPILAGSKSPALDSWKPYMTRLPTMRELHVWFGNARFGKVGYGIALITGWRDLVVVDWDDTLAYSRWLSSLNGEYSLVSRTYRVQTRRGVHLYFRCRDVQGWKGPGVDVKAAGGYVLAPPTIHPSGHQYASIGGVENIQRITAITDLLPDYRAETAETARIQARRDIDPFDAAMREHEHAGITVEELKARISWATIMPGLRADRGYHKTKCPIHQDDEPSFIIYPDGHAHCFGCDFHGDAIDAWAAMHNLTIGEAMADLADRFI